MFQMSFPRLDLRLAQGHSLRPVLVGVSHSGDHAWRLLPDWRFFGVTFAGPACTRPGQTRPTREAVLSARRQVVALGAKQS